jgi:hypothetical protein
MLHPKCVEYLLSYQVTPDRVRPTTAVQHIYKYVWARGEEEDEEEERRRCWWWWWWWSYSYSMIL